MEKKMLIAFGVITTSCYLFPFILAAFPIANSKMIMAAIGLMILFFRSNNQPGNVKHDFIILSIWALGVSFLSLFSTIINSTHDFEYASYVMSMWVWLGGAYCAVAIIRSIHSGISITLLTKYLLAVCVMQCFLALLFEYNGAASAWHNRVFGGNEGYMGALSDGSRMHGIGCALDVAGFRFAAVIAATIYLLVNGKFKESENYFTLFGIGIVVVVGDMISRSTFIGLALGIGYWLLTVLNKYKSESKGVAKYFTVSLFIIIILSVYFYNTNQIFHDNIRFGFEGFFSYFETGEWKSQSNDILKSMVVWPDNLHTWLIGDGYINNPLDKMSATYDPYYIGERTGGYYKGTDIGYLRFIFYFGVTGLVVFIGFFIEVFRICVKRFPHYTFLFLLILAVNFIEWFKVSTDVFVIFAPFLCITREENDDYEAHLIDVQSDDLHD